MGLNEPPGPGNRPAIADAAKPEIVPGNGAGVLPGTGPPRRTGLSGAGEDVGNGDPNLKQPLSEKNLPDRPGMAGNHLDSGPVASPNRDARIPRDGSDAGTEIALGRAWENGSKPPAILG